MLGNTLRIVNVVNAAAAMAAVAGSTEGRQAALIPELHREANDGIAAVVQNGGHSRAIHSAAHSDCGQSRVVISFVHLELKLE
jgi:hypothetical protein